MPELAENNTLFVSLQHLVPEILYFLYFNMASAAILDFEVKMAFEFSDWHFTEFVMPEIAEINTLFAFLTHLLLEILYMCIFSVFQDGRQRPFWILRTE